MEQAFLVGVAFPPPTPGPFLLPGLGRAGARRAPDRQVAAVIQRVLADAVIPEVVPHLVTTPSGERHDFGHAIVPRIAGNHRRGGACRRLISAQARDPGVVVAQRPRQGIHLADGAALIAQRYRLPKEHVAVFGCHRLDFLGLRGENAQPYRELPADVLDVVVRLLVEPSGVEGEHFGLGHDPAGKIDEHHRLRLEARDQSDAAEPPVRPGDDVLGCRILQIGCVHAVTSTSA